MRDSLFVGNLDFLMEGAPDTALDFSGTLNGEADCG